MKRLTASELVRNFGEYSDSALTEPAIITRNGRDRLVLLNIEEYHALRHVADMGENLREAKTAQRAISKCNPALTIVIVALPAAVSVESGLAWPRGGGQDSAVAANGLQTRSPRQEPPQEGCARSCIAY